MRHALRVICLRIHSVGEEKMSECFPMKCNKMN